MGGDAGNSCLNPTTDIVEMSWPLNNIGFKMYTVYTLFVILAFSMAQRHTK